MDDLKASNGWVITASRFGRESYRFANDHGRIKLIDGAELKSLLRQHLNLDVLLEGST